MHRGEKALGGMTMTLDSMVINADTTSLQGNFVLYDSNIIFLDRLYHKTFLYSCENGELTKAALGHGNGPNEISHAMQISSVSPGDSIMWIVDPMNGIYDYFPSRDSVAFTTRLDFQWGIPEERNLERPGVYNLQELSENGLTFTLINDSIVLIPVSRVASFLKAIDENVYEKGHIFGEVNLSTKKVRRVTGKYPDFFKDNPCPSFSYFDYVYDPETERTFVTFGPDSLVYCYQYPDSLLFTFGYAPHDVGRDYPLGYDIDYSKFIENRKGIGYNVRLFFDKENRLFLRTSVKNMETFECVVQVYDDKFNLVGEFDMPPYFIFLGSHGSNYYGARAIPKEYDNRSEFVFYKFRLSL